jgi:hypothetical protein
LVAAATAIVLTRPARGGARPARGGAVTCPGGAGHCVFVDGVSIGGRCSDRRSARQARSERTPWCSLRRAVAATPAGWTVTIRGGRYPLLHIADVDRAPKVTLRARAGERVELPQGIVVERSAGFRLQDLHVSSAETISTVLASRHIAIENSEFTRLGLVVRGVRDTTVSRNRFHDLERGVGPDGFDGYAIWANGFVDGGPSDGIDGLVIRGNVFRHIPQDGVQLGGGAERIANVTIEGNDFGFVRRARAGDHPDPIQIIGGHNVVIRSNYFHDSEDAIIAADDVTTGLRVENNLMVGWAGGCIQAQFWNTPGARIVGNTIWRSQCGGLRLAYDPKVGPPPSGIVVRRNIVDRYDAGDPGWVAQRDHNVIVHAARGPGDSGRRPQFADGFRPVGTAARLGAGSTVRPR